jgi:hypothetical protein
MECEAMIEENYYELIRDLIYKYGKRFKKKHGEWIKLQYTNDSFFEMDSWNRRIILKQGNGDYEYWMGFRGEVKECIGIDYGGQKVNTNSELLEFYYNNLCQDLKGVKNDNRL